MKNLTYILTFFLIGIVTACGPATKKEVEEEDDDSINAFATLREMARVDSLRQDSIEKYEKFAAAIPSFKQIDEQIDDEKGFFKNRGYAISSYQMKSWDYEIDDWGYYPATIATLEIGNYFAQYKRTDDGWQFTIKGAPDLLQKFSAEGKSYVAKMRKEYEGDWYYEGVRVTTTGNTVAIHYPEGD